MIFPLLSDTVSAQSILTPFILWTLLILHISSHRCPFFTQAMPWFPLLFPQTDLFFNILFTFHLFWRHLKHRLMLALYDNMFYIILCLLNVLLSFLLKKGIPNRFQNRTILLPSPHKWLERGIFNLTTISWCPCDIPYFLNVLVFLYHNNIF